MTDQTSPSMPSPVLSSGPTPSRGTGARFRLRVLVGVVALVFCGLAISAIDGTAQAFPKPATVPYRWQFDFEAGPLRLYQDRVDGAYYWYFTYQLVNRTGGDQIWAPNLDLFTDTGEILRAGGRVPGRVEEDIRDLLGNPLLEVQNEVIGDVFQGLEHAKDGLAVWPAGRVDVNEMSLFIGGLSGETARVKNPVTGREHILRKTLQRNYLIRGDSVSRGSKAIELVDQAWILR